MKRLLLATVCAVGLFANAHALDAMQRNNVAAIVVSLAAYPHVCGTELSEPMVGALTVLSDYLGHEILKEVLPSVIEAMEDVTSEWCEHFDEIIEDAECSVSDDCHSWPADPNDLAGAIVAFTTDF